MNTLTERIINEIELKPDAKPIWIRDFLHLGSRESVARTLRRLAQHERLFHAARGLYFKAIQGKYGVITAGIHKNVMALAEETGETITANGASLANNLGMCKHVPVIEIYWTSGPTRELRFDKGIVYLKHQPDWLLVRPWQFSGDAFRAIVAFGDVDTKNGLRRLKNKIAEYNLPGEELGELCREQLKNPEIPEWICDAMKEFLDE